VHRGPPCVLGGGVPLVDTTCRGPRLAWDFLCLAQQGSCTRAKQVAERRWSGSAARCTQERQTPSSGLTCSSCPRVVPSAPLLGERGRAGGFAWRPPWVC
jgi:hypothetical protein